MSFRDDLQDLRALVDAYATAADTRDDVLFASLFTADGVLRILQDDAVAGTFAAPDGLAAATAPLDQYRATMHLVANHACRVDGDAAKGSTYCLANHVRPVQGDADGAVENLQMVLRYDDDYARGADGSWRFARRDLHILWTEIHSASLEALRF